MGHYLSNLRDLEFNLFEVFRVQDYLGMGPFDQIDADVARDALVEVERLASTAFAGSFVEGDRTPLRLDDGDVTIPQGIKRSLDAFFDGEWHRMNLPPRLGGYGAPPSLRWAASEMLLGANPAVLIYCAGPAFAAILDRLVTEEQHERWVVPMVERRWGATMVLTEPDAGSDVGAGRAKAVAASDGTWHVTGTKRFITNGDFDWPENILHLVLARPEGAGPGTKGLSLFMVPKFWPCKDGSPGERNGVVVTKLEDKMGLKASSTCELTFGERVPARGVLVGERHEGIQQMFQVIEDARMMVGTKAIATLSTGYLNALAYAKERVQGPDLTQASDRTASRVPIMRHPDVRRMLMEQKAYVEGMRALVMYTATVQDRIRLAHAGAGAEGVGGVPHDLAQLEKLNDLLLPMVKGYGSEKSYELLAQSLQVLGGSGYCRDYPIEQYIRDAKIDTLYEGTTGIQGMDLFFRKVGKDQGATLALLLGEIMRFAKGDSGDGALAKEREILGSAVRDVQGMLAAMAGFLDRSIYLVGLNTTTFMFSLSELIIGWLLLRHAEVADAGDSFGRDKEFYEGKVAAARWFARHVLPLLSARRAVLEQTDLEVMDLPDAAF
ncbi:MAG: acyl-CoA dehydrogenase [Egibacteraceae bacterium]